MTKMSILDGKKIIFGAYIINMSWSINYGTKKSMKVSKINRVVWGFFFIL